MEHTQREFGYFLSEKGSILVVSLFGVISKYGTPSLQKCIDEVQSSLAKGVIVSFHDVIELHSTGLPDLVKLQVTIRKKPAHLRLCFMKPEITKLLDEKGSLRPNEVFENLEEALHNLVAQIKRDEK